MTKTELIMLASEYYPDSFIEQVWDVESETVIRGGGDTLAEFIAYEAKGSAEDHSSSREQVAALDDRLETAIQELQSVRGGLQAALEIMGDAEESEGA